MIEWDTCAVRRVSLHDGDHSAGPRGTASLVHLAAAGDEVAFARLIAAHDHALGRVAFVIAGDWTTAAEAVQVAWTIAWTRLPSLRDHDRIEPWLVSIAANETRRLLARQRRRTVVKISATPDPMTRTRSAQAACVAARPFLRPARGSGTRRRWPSMRPAGCTSPA